MLHPARSLLLRSKINSRWKVTPEQSLAIEVADSCRKWTLEGNLKAVWHTIPNEAKRHVIVALILRAMGMLSGVADMSFKGRWGAGYIELKAPTAYKISEATGEMIVDRAAGKSTENQKTFKEWCVREGVGYEVCNSVADVERVLKLWGALEFEQSKPLGGL